MLSWDRVFSLGEAELYREHPSLYFMLHIPMQHLKFSILSQIAVFLIVGISYQFFVLFGASALRPIQSVRHGLSLAVIQL